MSFLEKATLPNTNWFFYLLPHITSLFPILGVINAPDINFEGELANINQRFRKGLDLYANVVKVQSLPGVQSRHSGIDMVIIREQTEGEYSALEHESVKGKNKSSDNNFIEYI